jgi:hypothetical protein
MSADRRIIPAEALRNEVVIKRAPVVTATELLGGKVEEFGGLRLAESPIHGFRIERPTGVEIFAFMPEARLGQDQFHRLLHSVAPALPKDEGYLDLGSIMDDMELIDPENPRRLRYLDAIHKKLGRDWTDYESHFPLLFETLQDMGTDVVKGLIASGHGYGMHSFRFKGIPVGNKYRVWSASDEVVLDSSPWTDNPQPEAEVELRYEDDWYDLTTGESRSGHRDDDKRRIALTLKLNEAGRRVEVQYKDIFKAEIPSYKFRGNQDLRYVDTSGVEIVSANDLIPAFRISIGNNDKRKWNVAPEADGVGAGILEPYIESFGLPQELVYDIRRFNPIAGLLTAAHLSPEITGTWSEKEKIPGSRPNDMGGAQVQVRVLQERRALANSAVMVALADHVKRNAV